MDSPKPREPHPIDVVPTATRASPGEMPHLAFGDDVPFWKPDWRDVSRQLGWRWLLFLPAIFFLVVILLLPWNHAVWSLLYFGGAKLLILSIGGAIGIAGSAVRSAVKLRTDPFCIHCGYDLTGLPDGHLCPECGRPFSLRLIDEYRRDPHWFVKRYSAHKSAPMADAPFDAGPVQRKPSRDGT